MGERWSQFLGKGVSSPLFSWIHRWRVRPIREYPVRTAATGVRTQLTHPSISLSLFLFLPHSQGLLPTRRTFDGVRRHRKWGHWSASSCALASLERIWHNRRWREAHSRHRRAETGAEWQDASDLNPHLTHFPIRFKDTSYYLSLWEENSTTLSEKKKLWKDFNFISFLCVILLFRRLTKDALWISRDPVDGNPFGGQGFQKRWVWHLIFI